MRGKEKTECPTKTNINWYPGHMAKTKREIKEDLKFIDVVIELLDARIPIASQNPDIGELVKEKKRIVLLNKADLACQAENKKWITWFQKQGIIAIETNCSTGYNLQEVLNQIGIITKEEQEKAKAKGLVGKTIRAMVLGIPNSGKSSFINRLSKKQSVKVENRPGVTKQKQWIRVGERIELLDTPGVLWPKFESEEVGLHLAYTGTIKDDIIEKEEIAYHLLKFLAENYPQNLVERYGVDEKAIEKTAEDNLYELYEEIGRKRGALLSGGRVDSFKIATILLEDFKSGKLGNITIEKVGEV